MTHILTPLLKRIRALMVFQQGIVVAVKSLRALTMLLHLTLGVAANAAEVAGRPGDITEFPLV